MQIEKIIYDTTRSFYSVEDKLSIATIFIFCWKLSSAAFARLLYTDDHERFIRNLNADYAKHDVNFSIRLSDKNIRECFYKTLEKVKEKYDDKGFYKALYEGDEFAQVISEIMGLDFKEQTKTNNL